MLLRKLTILAIPLLLAACATDPHFAAPDGDIYIKAELILVERAPSCGIILAGSPATYRVTSGPDTLRGRQINVLVACIEMPMVQGDLREFTPGSTHYLILTKKNSHKIEMPADLPDQTWFYLKAASDRELRPNNSFKPSPHQGGA